MLFVALDKQGGVLPAEFFVLRELRGTQAIAAAGYPEQREYARSAQHFTGPAPGEVVLGDVPPGVDVVTYESAGNQLPAWIWYPDDVGPHRALVYLHDGFELSTEDFERTQPFRDAGYVVLMPTLRGETGNPGSFELFLGEVDDAAAAVRWVAASEAVDPDHVYAFGASATGGTLASLLALVPDLGLRHSGSAGAILLDTEFAEISEMAPFDCFDRGQTSARAILGHTDEMRSMHYAWRDGQSPWFPSFVIDDDAALVVRRISGSTYEDHLQPALARYLACATDPARCPRSAERLERSDAPRSGTRPKLHGRSTTSQ